MTTATDGWSLPFDRGWAGLPAVLMRRVLWVASAGIAVSIVVLLVTVAGDWAPSALAAVVVAVYWSRRSRSRPFRRPVLLILACASTYTVLTIAMYVHGGSQLPKPTTQEDTYASADYLPDDRATTATSSPPPRPSALPGFENDDSAVVTTGVDDRSRTIKFDYDSAVLSVDAATRLDKLAHDVLVPRSLAVVVTGRADSRGSDAHNLELSLRRAQAVADRLIAAGVNPSMILVDAVGEGEPIWPDVDREGQFDDAAGQANRSVEIFVF